MDTFKPFIAKVATGASLLPNEAREAFDMLLSGEVTPAQAAGFLMSLRVRGETVDEISGAVTALRARMIKVAAPASAMDIVGTGGDNAGTYNVSTLASLIVASCGVPVAKHGNRAASSKSGTADVLTALGVKVGLDAPGVERCIAQAGIGFMFAPAHHASMRNVAPVRTELGTRTIFNLIGPLSNPAGVRRQLLGAFAESWLKPMVDVLKGLGSERVWAVCGADGLDEITTTGPTHVVALENRAVRTFTITPEDVGMKRVGLDALRGGAPDHNAAALNAVLDGAHTPYRDIAVLNAAASLVVAEAASSLSEGVERAGQALASGAVKGTLARLVAASQG